MTQKLSSCALFLMLALLILSSACSPAAPQTPTQKPTTAVQATLPPPTQTPAPTIPPPAPTQNQAMFRGGLERLGVYATEGDFGEWAINAGGPITSSPALADGTLFYTTMTGEIQALDPATQKLKWQAKLSEAAFSSPVAAAGKVFAADLRGAVFAFDAASGKQLWKIQTGGPVIASPAVADSEVYVPSYDGALYALDAQTGKELWKYQTKARLSSSPAVVDGMVLFGSSEGFLYALDEAEGTVEWMYMAESEIVSSPAVAQGRVVIASQSETNSAHCIDLYTGKAIWKRPFGRVISTPAISGDTVYGANINGFVVAASLADGSPRWEYRAEAVVVSSPAVVADQVILGDSNGRIFALDRLSGEELWAYQTNGEVLSSPAIGGETVFVGSADAKLYAINRTAPKLAAQTFPASLPLQPTPTMLPEPPEPARQGADGLPWWNERVFYEVFVRSFKDGSGDGIGDLQGLIEKLDYLNDGDPSTTEDLGVTGIWLMPVAESPSYHGYDVSDYYKIESDYGTNADFQKLVGEAHKRGIAVIVDMVLNHTSTAHPWFRQAAYPGSETANWYIWSDQPGDYQSPWGSEVWHQPDGGNLENLRMYHTLRDYYYGLFWEGMPDLNYRNGAVTEEMFKILKFWLDDLGADGFRLDAVRHLIEDGEIQENTPETHAWLQNFDNYVHTVKPETMTVGEIWDDTVDVAPYVPDEVDTAFEFKLAEAMLAAVNNGDNALLNTQMQTVLDTYPEGQFAPFLTNHDMNRSMTEFGNDTDKAKLAAALLLTAPGVPFIYYGEEIGLTGTRPEDVNVRRPMQWDATPNRGFSSAEPWTGLGTPNPAVDVAAESADPFSLLSRYRELIHLRQAHPALLVGDTWVVTSTSPGVYSLLRASGDETLLVVANLTGQPLNNYSLSLASSPLKRGMKAENLFGNGSPAAPKVNSSGGFEGYTPLKELPPYGVLIVGLK